MKVRDIITAAEPQWIENSKYNEISPLITIVLPTFKRAESGDFERAVESVISQTYTNWELIIVDDSSNDGTADLIRFYMEIDSRISCIRHTYNMGLLAISQYEAYRKARGEYIAYIFDDNEWSADHLMLSMKAMIKNKAKFTCGISRVCFEDDEYTDIKLELGLLPYTNVIGNSAVVMHKDVIENVGLYDPHVVLTRFCDWDLWRRIIKEYHISKIDNVVTKEYRNESKRSFNKKAVSYPWTAIEQISASRNTKLLPENFEEYDIDELSDVTDLFYETTIKYYEKYSDKKWWKEADNSSGTLVSKKKIVVATGNFDASLSLSFDALNSSAIIKFAPIRTIPAADLAFADAIVFIRAANYAVDFAKDNKYKIPIYYYIDDNFIELIKCTEFVEDAGIKAAAACLNRSDLKNFKGIITSTDELKEYFESQKLHHNVTTLPVCAADYNKASSKKEGSINIAFMGGKFREDTFLYYIYPAIRELSADVKVKLVCPDSLAERIRTETEYDNEFEIKAIARDVSYHQIMHMYGRENIHILIHSGEEHVNNKYKTLNSMVNAVGLGAVLITSDIPPFTDEPTVVTCENTIQAWTSTLRQYALNDDTRNERFSHQQRFVEDNFSVESVSAVFDSIVSRVRSIGIADAISRYDTMLSEPVKSKKTEEVVHDAVSNNYNFIDNILNFNELAAGTPIVYKINKRNTAFSEIGFIFSTDYTKFRGTVTAEILDSHNKCVASATIDLSDVNIREVNMFDFGTVLHNKNKVRLTANYFGPETVGVYELAAKRSFLFKVFKKVFKKRLLISDLVYYELNTKVADS